MTGNRQSDELKISDVTHLCSGKGGKTIVCQNVSKTNERKSEQAHIPHAPTLLENTV